MYIKVHVTPGARKERVIKTDATRFDIEVKEPALQNMANKRIREILAREFGVSLGKVQMLTGHRSPSKIFSIE